MPRRRHTKEDPWRRLLRLPAERPEPGPFVMGSEDEDGTFGIARLPDDEHRRQRLAWHAEGWRGDLANSLAYGPHRTLERLRWKLDAPAEKLRRHRARRALASQRTLHYTCYYIPTRDTNHIEGYFDFGSYRHFQLDIYTPTAMKTYTDFEWEHRELVSSENSLVFGSGRWIVAPSETLTEDVLRETLLRWYEERFEYERGHWSQVEETLPEIVLDIEWESDEERAERETYLAEVAADEADTETSANV